MICRKDLAVGGGVTLPSKSSEHIAGLLILISSGFLLVCLVTFGLVSISKYKKNGLLYHTMCDSFGLCLWKVRLRIFKNRWFEKFSRKENIDEASLVEAIDRIIAGAIDADLGSGVIKQRVARDGAGKSGGFRTIILFKIGNRAVFVFGFAKSDKSNLSKTELVEFRKVAKIILALSDAQIQNEIDCARLFEVKTND